MGKDTDRQERLAYKKQESTVGSYEGGSWNKKALEHTLSFFDMELNW